jgi:threonine dehydratase
MTLSTLTPRTATPWPVAMETILATRARLTPYLPPTALRRYRPLEEHVGRGIQLFVKHENHQPTNSFKIRNGLSCMTSRGREQLARGVVAASTGNHGQGIAYAGSLLGADVTICVPTGNNPEKNAAMRSYGARVVEEGRDYDEAVGVMQRIASMEGRTIAHSTNDPAVIAGAATMTLEILEREPALDALVLAVGGGSQAVGALTVARALRPQLAVYGVQAAGASAIHDSWHAREPRTTARADTFAEGVATRSTYELTFPTLLEGLAGFVTVADAETAAAMRVILSATHNLVEGAGAMGLAGLLKLRDQLAGRRVAIVFCGGNVDTATLRRVLNGEL